MAGAMAEVARQTLAGISAASIRATARIVLVEAGPRMLPAFPENLSGYAQPGADQHGCGGEDVHASDRLRRRRRHLERAAHRGRDNHLGRRRGRFAGGAWLDAERDRAGRVKVGSDLRYRDSRKFSSSAIPRPWTAERQPVPGVAPAAKQMGRYVGAADRLAHRGQALNAAVPLSPYGGSRHHRPPGAPW